MKLIVWQSYSITYVEDIVGNVIPQPIISSSGPDICIMPYELEAPINS